MSSTAASHPYIDRSPLPHADAARQAVESLNADRHRGGACVEVTYYFSVDHRGPAMAGLINAARMVLEHGTLKPWHAEGDASLQKPSDYDSFMSWATDIRLLELSNLNTPILQRLSVEAPGTYHHSLMVGTLAEAAAEAIGANPLLARVGGYYHDLGKILHPEYFVENQAAGVNRHESLTPTQSSQVLARHVEDGLELAKEAGLVETVRDLIPQHHGTRVMSYFYEKAKGSAVANGGEVQEGNFRYPGPKPQSKEAAILMMADAVEAAARTLSNPSTAAIQGLIDRLVEDILADRQLDECNITIRDIRLVKGSFLKSLSGQHHHRIDYPGYDFTRPENLPVKGPEDRAAPGRILSVSR